MLKKCFFKCLCLFIVLGVLCTNICYATVITVTDEKLNESLQKFVSSEDANEENYNITVSNNVITVTVDDENYTLNYDLTDKPTFSLELPIQKGMSYDEFKNKTGNLILPMLGYVAVANIQGVEVEDASAYIMFSYLKDSLKGSSSTKNSYVIVDDLDVTDGVTIEKTDDPKIIYTSEFGDRVIEYVNNMYKDKQSTSDSTGINSFFWTIEKLDTTDTSCKLVSKLSVNLDADFSKINGYMDKIENSFTNNDEEKKENTQTQVQDKIDLDTLPKTGEEINGFLIVLYIIVGICSIGLLALSVTKGKKK